MMRASAWVVLAALLAAGLGPAVATAAPDRIVVRAGEHADFSRVLFPVKLENGWSFDQRGREIVVTLRGFQATFDTSAIYPRRAAHRVLKVKTERRGKDTVFRFQLACACHGRLYELGGTRLVLDVADHKASASAPQPSAAKADPALDQTDADAIERVRQRLVEQLRRAEEEGIVSFREPAAPAETTTPVSPNWPDSPSGSQQAAAAAPATGEEPVPAAPAPSLTVAAIDPRAQGDRDAPAQAVTPSDASWSCRDNEDFDPTAWQSNATPMAQLSDLRGQLIGEFDRPNDAAVLALARSYLSLGMAPEARAVLAAFDAQAGEGAFLLDLAALLEHRALSPRGPVLGPGPCEGRHGVLQAFALGLQDQHDRAAAAELRGGDALLTLPRQIRSVVAAELALSAVEAGRLDQAVRLIAIAEQAGEAYLPEIDLAQGLLALRENRQQESERLLSRLVDMPGDAGATAAVTLALHKLKKGEPLPENLLLALDGVAIERRYTAIGRQALILAAQGLLRGGRALQAGERLLAENRADQEGRPQLTAALLALLEEAAQQQDKPASLALLLTVLPALNDAPALAPLKRLTARRLIANGLPEAAAGLVASDPSHEGRALLVQALIDSGRVEDALAAVETLAKGEAKSTLRQRALAAQGQYAVLARSLREPSLETLAEFAWLGGDWTQASTAYAKLSERAGHQPDAVADLRRAAAAFMQGDPKYARHTANALRERSAGAAALAARPGTENVLVLDNAETRLRYLMDLQAALKELIDDG